MKYKCICGHNKNVHVSLVSVGWKDKCEDCMTKAFLNGIFNYESFPSLHPFTTDNLDYIETVAKQKGLV